MQPCVAAWQLIPRHWAQALANGWPPHSAAQALVQGPPHMHSLTAW
jgi:hypothetical protein